MKIKKSQLIEIIREEVRRILNETSSSDNEKERKNLAEKAHSYAKKIKDEAKKLGYDI